MSLHLPARALCMTAVAAVGVSMTLLAGPAAQAAPVFTDASTQLDAFGDVTTNDFGGGSDCTRTVSGGTEPSVPVVENGPAASAATSVSGTYANAGDPADTGNSSASVSGTAKIASAGGSVSTMDFATQSSGLLSNALGGSPDCFRSVSAGLDFDFELTVSQPGFLTLTGKNVGSAYGGVGISRTTPAGQEVYVSSAGSGLRSNYETKVYLVAGTYTGTFESSSFVSGSGTISGSTTVHGEFTLAGAQTSAASGKGTKFVTVPATRSCATDTVTPTITNKKSRVSDVKQVTFFVNDKLIAKVKKPKKGAEIKLGVADEVTAALVVEVRLFPARKGRPGKVYEVATSYEACS